MFYFINSSTVLRSNPTASDVWTSNHELTEGRERSICGLIFGYWPWMFPGAQKEYLAYKHSTWYVILSFYVDILWEYTMPEAGPEALSEQHFKQDLALFLPNLLVFVIHGLPINHSLLATSLLQGGIWNWRSYKRKKHSRSAFIDFTVRVFHTDVRVFVLS